MASEASIVLKSAGVNLIHPKGGSIYRKEKLYITIMRKVGEKYQKQDKGLVIVYTGNGKGKTTAALGLAVRAAGYNRRILLVQFGKNQPSGEIKSLKLLKSLKIIRGGKGFVGILGDKLSLEEHKKSAQDTYQILYKELLSGKWDLVIADEIIGAIKGGLVSLKQVLLLVGDKPRDADLVLTGRFAPAQLIKAADLVTEMKEIKHPFVKGIQAKRGIDY